MSHSSQLLDIKMLKFYFNTKQAYFIVFLGIILLRIAFLVVFQTPDSLQTKSFQNYNFIPALTIKRKRKVIIKDTLNTKLNNLRKAWSDFAGFVHHFMKAMTKVIVSKIAKAGGISLYSTRLPAFGSEMMPSNKIFLK